MTEQTTSDQTYSARIDYSHMSYYVLLGEMGKITLLKDFLWNIYFHCAVFMQFCLAESAFLAKRHIAEQFVKITHSLLGSSSKKIRRQYFCCENCVL